VSASITTRSLPYVIVGRGFSATVNRAMLLQVPGSSLAGKQLIHIGEPDPWRQYVHVEMGQWPLLLTLPAYTMRPSSSQYRLMDSLHFALITASHASMLVAHACGRAWHKYILFQGVEAGIEILSEGCLR